MHRWRCVLEQPFQPFPSGRGRGFAKVLVPLGQEVEGDVGGWGFGGQLVDSRLGRMKAHLQGFEVEGAAP